MTGRPSRGSGVYFRLYWLGYPLGLNSGRLALQAADSLAKREFVGF